MAAKKSPGGPPSTVDAEDEWMELQASYRELHKPSAYEKRSKPALAKVTEWRWANDQWLRPTPFYREKFKGPVLKWLKPGADRKQGDVEHGLDASGLIHVMRPQKSSPSNCTVSLALRQTSSNGEILELISFVGKWPGDDVGVLPTLIDRVSLGRHWFDGERLLAEVSLGQHGIALDRYIYDRSKLVSSTFDSVHHRNERRIRIHRDYRYHYTPDGEIERIESDHYFLMPEPKLTTTETVFRRKKK